jgi:hypothetical protein
LAALLSDWNDGSRFDGTRLRLVGDQLAQERNQHDERNTDREAAEAKLGDRSPTTPALLFKFSAHTSSIISGL